MFSPHSVNVSRAIRDAFPLSVFEIISDVTSKGWLSVFFNPKPDISSALAWAIIESMYSVSILSQEIRWLRASFVNCEGIMMIGRKA